jgi:hypothetical protein
MAAPSNEVVGRVDTLEAAGRDLAAGGGRSEPVQPHRRLDGEVKALAETIGTLGRRSDDAYRRRPRGAQTAPTPPPPRCAR